MLVTDFKTIIKKIFNPKNRIKLFVAIGMIGVALILLSEIPSSTNDNKKTNDDIVYSQYVEELESKTNKILSSMSGVGKCKVMITLDETNESFFAQNKDEKYSDSSSSKNHEYVLYDGDDGDEPLLIKQKFPTVCGVVVVCDGGDNVVVREKIIDSIASLYNIPTSKICVSKLEG